MKKDARTLTAFRLSAQEKKELEEVAELDDLSMSAAVRQMIKRAHTARVVRRAGK